LNKKLYVGNLSYSVGDQQLNDLFSKVGPVVSATVLKDRYSGRSRGFGFVEMEEKDAQKAIKELDGKEFEGRKLVVNEARPRREEGFSRNKKVKL